MMSSDVCQMETQISYNVSDQQVSSGYSDILEETLKMLLSMCDDEPARLQELNNRFASYIQRIHQLVKDNQNLVEVVHLRVHETKRISSLYEEQLKKKSEEIGTLASQKKEMDAKLKELTFRLETENKLRMDAEQRIAILIKEGNSPNLETYLLKIRSLEEDISLMKKVYEEKDTKYCLDIKTVIDTVDGPKTDLTLILKKIREDMTIIAKGNVKEMETLYKSRISEWKRTLREREEELVEARQKISDFNLQIHSNTCEISSLKATIEALKNQIKRMVECHKLEIEGLQRKITDLNEHISSKENEMGFYVQKYQGLHSAKVAMNLEIAAYKHLLEFEEGRINEFEPSIILCNKGETWNIDLEAFRQEISTKITEETWIYQHEDRSFEQTYQEIGSAEEDKSGDEAAVKSISQVD
ncbi:PREDICTED: desmin-like [Cyprinodon variegatus]|nr:PREDICTED: desmin-like [Cyprinodon variegatus]